MKKSSCVVTDHRANGGKIFYLVGACAKVPLGFVLNPIIEKSSAKLIFDMGFCFIRVILL